MEDFSIFDMEQEGTIVPSDLPTLNKMLKQAIQLEETIEMLENNLKVTKKALHSLRTNRIPDLMAELGVDQITFEGWKVSVQDLVSGSLPSDPYQREKAIAWLEDHGGGSLIKTDLKLQFPKSESDQAKELADALRAEGFTPRLDFGVHPQSFQAFIREKVRNGEDVDVDTLGVYIGKVAKFSEVKK